MNVRILSITVAILLALCAVVWFVQRPGPPAAADPRVGQPLLAADTATQAVRVKFSDQTKTVELARAADGSWTVASYHDFPADLAKLRGLITELTDARIQRLVTARADRLGRLEFKDTKIALAADAGQELWQVTLGKTADRGGRYVRFGTEEKGYLVDKSLWLDAEPKNWADTTLLNLRPDDIARVELSFTGGAQVSVSRAKKDDPWAPAAPTAAPAGKRLKADRMTSLLPSVTSLHFTETVEPSDPQALAAQAHARTIKLTTFDQKTYTVTFARRPEQKRPKPVEAKKNDAAAATAETKAAEPAKETPAATDAKPADEKPKEPEFETIPAGPVFVKVEAADEKAPVNSLMKKRAFQIAEWSYTSLPASADELWESVPETAPTSTPTPPTAEPAPKAPTQSADAPKS